LATYYAALRTGLDGRPPLLDRASIDRCTADYLERHEAMVAAIDRMEQSCPLRPVRQTVASVR
jgi:hypothetical protein